MAPMIKVQCAKCRQRYYILIDDIELLLPDRIEIGEAFPKECPLCEDGDFAIFIGLS